MANRPKCRWHTKYAEYFKEFHVLDREKMSHIQHSSLTVRTQRFKCAAEEITATITTKNELLADT